ncbi:MAG: hypothetical protein JWL89_446 [Candidatus Saccharibacteria bacterium]|nr:hypothetical protein [Candidatus Saccharibacteria bacterium]
MIEKYPSDDPVELARLFASDEHASERAEMARRQAEKVRQEARLEAWFDGTQENAADLQNYFKRRPYKDSGGNTHIDIPQEGHLLRSADAYFDAKRAIARTLSLKRAAQDSYADLAATQLVVELAKAEHAKDSTLQGHIGALIASKVYEIAERERQRDPVAATTRVELTKSVMRLKDRKLEALQTDTPSHPQGENGQQAEAATAPSPEQTLAHGELVQYEPDEQSNIVQLGIEVTKPGTVLKWSEHEYTKGSNRQILLHTQDGKVIYVAGDTIYDLDGSQETGQLQNVVLDDEEELPEARIGENWEIAEEFTNNARVNEVEIAYKTANAEHDDLSQCQKRGRNPFASAPKLIAELKNKASGMRSGAAAPQGARIASTAGLAGAAAVGGRRSLRERSQDALRDRRARAGVLVGVLLASIALGYGAERLLSGSSEHETTKPQQSTVVDTQAKESSGSQAKPKASKPNFRNRSDETTETVTIRAGSGDTIWHEVSRQLQQEGTPATPYNVWFHTQHVLHINHLTWEQAHHLGEKGDVKIKLYP